MLRQEDYIVIKTLHDHGVYQKDIAAELGVHPKTVSRALKRGEAPQRRRRRRGSKLDPYKAKADQLLSEGVWNAVVILREIQAEGYEGGLSWHWRPCTWPMPDVAHPGAELPFRSMA